MPHLVLREGLPLEIAPRARDKHTQARRGSRAALTSSSRMTNHSARMTTLNAALEEAALTGQPYRVTIYPGRGASVAILDWPEGLKP